MSRRAKANLIGPFLQLFFVEHLVCTSRQRQTIASYRDTFRLLLQFMHKRTGSQPAALSLAAVDVDAVMDFLNYLERDRKCSGRSPKRQLPQPSYILPLRFPARSD